MIVKTKCGCHWLALAEGQYLQISDCCDEHSQVFLSATPRTSKDMMEIEEQYSLNSPLGLKWVDRLSWLVQMGEAYMGLAQKIQNLNNIEIFRGLPS